LGDWYAWLAEPDRRKQLEALRMCIPLNPYEEKEPLGAMLLLALK